MIDILKNRINAILKIANEVYSANANLSSATKGSEREIFIREILGKIFPNAFRFSCGDIIDSNGISSGEVDIALEFPHEPSFPLPGGEERLLLAESVITIIEVKSNLSDSKQWNDFIDKIGQIHKLKRRLNPSGSTGDPWGIDKFAVNPKWLENNIPCIGVFYKGPKKIGTIKNKLNKLNDSQKPFAILTLDQGYFLYKENELSNADGLFGFIFLLTILSNVFQMMHSHMINYLFKDM